jgi:hypothetical protein
MLSMSQADQVKTLGELVKVFERMVLTPGMYVRNTEYSVETFLAGFYVACQALGLGWSPTDALYQKITVDRGWEWHASYGPSFEMRRKKVPEEEITVVMLQIELEYWRRRVAQLKSASRTE